jgi:hypothetical protein
VVCSLLLTSEMMKNPKTIQQLDEILNLLYVNEKFLMKAVENFGTNIDEVIMIFHHFFDMYFKEDHTLSFGEKIFTYDQLIDNKYLEEVCTSEIFTVLRKKEQRLVTNCLNSFSLIIKHFLFPNTVKPLVFFYVKENDPGKEEIMASVQNCFVQNLDIILDNLMNKYLAVDPEDIYKLKNEPEEFFHEVDARNDDTIEIRVE